MRIEKLSDSKIKVTVNKEDIKIWNVNMSNLTDNTPEAQDLFWFALRQAEKDVDFRVGEAQLLVEAMPVCGEGFVMIISKMAPGTDVMDAISQNGRVRKAMDIRVKRRNRSVAPVNIFRFSDFEDVCEGVRQIGTSFCGKSALYKYKNTFYLILIPYDAMNFFETENIISEFGSRVQNPHISDGVLREHGKQLIKEFAVETMLAHFA